MWQPGDNDGRQIKDFMRFTRFPPRFPPCGFIPCSSQSFCVDENGYRRNKHIQSVTAVTVARDKSFKGNRNGSLGRPALGGD